MISQLRMKALIEAAQDFEQGLRKLLEYIESVANYDPSSGVRTIASKTLNDLLCDPAGSSKALATEAEHLRLTWKRNQRRARQRERSSRASGVESQLDLEAYLKWKEEQGEGQ